MVSEHKSAGVFYGWFVVAACFAITLTLGETFWSFGVFFKSLENEFGWSRSLVSSGYTAFLVGHAVSLVASGRLVDRYSPRPFIVASALIAGAGISLCSQIESVSQFRLFLFVAGVGAGPTWSVPNSTVMRWFYGRPRAGLALAIVTAGVGVGALVFAPLINYFIERFGWRDAFLYVGIVFFIILGISSLVIRGSPPAAASVSGHGPQVLGRQNTQRPKVRKLLVAPAFIGITFIMAVAILVFHALSVHLTPHATDVGLSRATAAAALGLIGGFSIPGRIVSGVISDRIGWQRTLAVGLLGMALSVIWLLVLHDTWMIYCFALTYGVCHGVRIPAQLGILSQFFGAASLGQLIGVSTAVGQLAGAFAPSLAGFLYDTTGSYVVVFFIMIAALLGASLAAVRMKGERELVY